MLSKIQTEIVQEVVSCISSEWDKVNMDVEIGLVKGDLVTSPKAYFNFGEKREQFSINYDAVLLFEELRESMQEKDSEHRAWSVCYLEIESNGQYVFNFSYDAPARLTKLQNN